MSVGSARVRHVMPGIPLPVPYGAHLVRQGVQFTLFSRHASRVWLMLFDAPDAAVPMEEIELRPDVNRIGDIWHIHVPYARKGHYYLYRMEGRAPPGQPDFFNPHQWLLDPYALAVSGRPTWGDPQGLAPGHVPRNGSTFPKGIIVEDDFDWSGDHTLSIPLNRTVIYEAHLRGYTAHPTAGVRHPGTYAGFHEKIPYLQKLGVTAVEFLPVQEFDELEYRHENMGRRHLRNLWGYSTLAFFAPNGRYAAHPGQQVREFKKLVMALHRAGIEVILDVVFNHTGEGGDGGPTYSFRGIDNSIYYLMDDARPHYLNYAGCGNTVNGNHPVVRDFILNCLRYWVLQMHVDGFRFDLASVLTRGRDGQILPNPPLVEHIAEDPVLRHTKIIAEAWDAAGTYQVGSFPSDRWSEWNGRYRDDVRRFWRGDPGLLSALATRLCGSPDLYDKPGQSPLKSINFITAHDGFTLADLVSYEHKRNQANGEDNADGERANYSQNAGFEGPTDDPLVMARRLKLQKNLLATLFVSQGVPMLLGGDEFGRSQGGNNNAYCQDNEVSWVDWSLTHTHRDLVHFTRELIRFRSQHPVLRRERFLTGLSERPGVPADITWFGIAGAEPDWTSGRAVGFLLSGQPAISGLADPDDDLCVLINGDGISHRFHLPAAGGRPWERALCTQHAALHIDQNTLVLEACSVAILQSRRLE